ncbi:hypothetical protein PMI01_00960 [Caulobacter sp. AP07]|uniref:hypothetical protein n=1 Tax=Caulobacter sp. AP07 TaxID=1144304 RepID=UPI0002721ADD|nr:hypothetical protein [Caulobacter sp. AP07]EJL36559.1 hypothetical protein PMI01_00960 [Caulobacter sp. AP07]
MPNPWRRGAKFVALLGGAVLLTILTQVGGIVLLAVAGIGRARRWSFGIATIVFLLAYAATTTLIVPPAAKALGRERLPCFARRDQPYGAINPLLCALNRTYARPRAKAVVSALADRMALEFPGTTTRYLDAGFPFLDGFPLMPHLSHRDGLKIDLAYFYREHDGRTVLDGAASPIGYWAYEAPRPGELRPCANPSRLNLRWDFAGLQSRVTRRADPERMAAMLRWLTTDGRELGVRKILIEPHLKQRWAPGVDMVRFQGCRAARHDDHLHLDIKPAD